MQDRITGAQTDELPIEVDGDLQKEAADILTRNLDATPMIRGINEMERLEAWTTVAQRLEISGRELKALRQRAHHLDQQGLDVDEEFSTGNEAAADAETPAVADGGGDVGTAAAATEGADTDSETMEYQDDAEFESKKREAEKVAKMFTDVDAVEEKLQEEHASDVVRPHVIEALEERLRDLGGEE